MPRARKHVMAPATLATLVRTNEDHNAHCAIRDASQRLNVLITEGRRRGLDFQISVHAGPTDAVVGITVFTRRPIQGEVGAAGELL